MAIDWSDDPGADAWALARARARNPNDLGEVVPLAKSFRRFPEQTATFYLRDGVEYVRVASAFDPFTVADRAASNVDRARWATEYQAFKAGPG